MKNRIQKIEDVENPVVGTFYLVPHIEATRHKLNCYRKWQPVIGPWHEDTDIGVAEYHFHYDVRFYSDRELDRCADHIYGRFKNLSAVQTKQFSAYPITGQPDAVPPSIKYFRRLMRRQMLEFPKNTKVTPPLEKQFKHVRMKCMTCPHRGMSLKGLPVAADGTVVCNGHGLKWNLKTGEMIER